MTCLKRESPLFNFASKTQKHTAVANFLTFVAQASGPYAQQQKWAQQAVQAIASGTIDTAREIDYAIATADATLFDEMRPEHIGDEAPPAGWTDRAAFYRRFFIYHAWFPEAVTQAIAKQCKTKIKLIMVGYPEHIESLYDGVGHIGMLTPEFAYWCNGPKIMPPIGVARQDLFASLLACGINPFENTAPCDKQQLIADRPPRYIQKYWRLAHLTTRVNPRNLADFETCTTQHWANLLTEGAPTNGKTVLFNSGSAANESVIAGLAEHQNSTAYTHPYWYFENTFSIKRLFTDHQTETHDQASVVFLNLEPVTFDLWEKPSASPEQVICDLSQNAQRKPQEQHVLVVDVTLNPLFSVTQTLGGSIPENLCVIKTISASKYQKGGRNYFFGIAHLLNPCPFGITVMNSLTKHRKRVGGVLGMRHHLHFPRPSRQWLQQTCQRLTSINQSLSNGFPENSEWHFAPYTQYAFLLPPQRLLKKLREEFLAISQCVDVKNLKRICNKLQGILRRPLIGKDVYKPYSSIEPGNSFGLSTSRVFWDMTCLSVSAIKQHKQNDMVIGLRLSPGTDPNATAMLQDFLRDACTRFEESIEDALLYLARRRTWFMLMARRKMKL